MASAGRTVLEPSPVKPEESPFTSRVGRAPTRSKGVKPCSPAHRAGAPEACR